MKQVKVNARGLACPQPVISSKNALADIEHGEVLVSVDNPVAVDNIKRMAEQEGYDVTLEDRGKDDFTIKIVKNPLSSIAQECATAKNLAEETVSYFFDSDSIGTNRELGKVLINGFLNTMISLPKRKSRIIFISNGVRLTTSGSYVLDTLRKLQNAGIEILICGTCLDFFKIRDKVQVGSVSNALEIMETLTNSGKVIKF